MFTKAYWEIFWWLTLSLYLYISGLNDSVCIPLVKTLSNLRIIDLSWNSSLTDDSLVNLFHSCQFIQEVTVAGLKRISSKPFLSIISGLVKWQQVRSVIKHRLHLKYFTSSGRLKHVTDLEVKFCLCCLCFFFAVLK